ncbi:hypothetical protein DICVIV_04713 [Dictyocaulus viviparus]|uniref:Uncharacterized protein n=1 Tax=Dictyocaulus viviparus TaxID=29172 RepID=A0A0D8XXC3_DICVI|nr:hypothetical protein DICVIV_04713 [Dictyocaulus viviparus]
MLSSSSLDELLYVSMKSRHDKGRMYFEQFEDDRLMRCRSIVTFSWRRKEDQQYFITVGIVPTIDVDKDVNLMVHNGMTSEDMIFNDAVKFATHPISDMYDLHLTAQ